MKKTFAFIFACMLGFAVIGCGDAKKDAPKDAAPAAEATGEKAAEEATPAPATETTEDAGAQTEEAK